MGNYCFNKYSLAEKEIKAVGGRLFRAEYCGGVWGEFYWEDCQCPTLTSNVSLSLEQTVLSGAGSWVLGSESSGKAGDVGCTRLTEEIWGRKISQFTYQSFLTQMLDLAHGLVNRQTYSWAMLIQCDRVSMK